jgi:hypothetical protein
MRRLTVTPYVGDPIVRAGGDVRTSPKYQARWSGFELLKSEVSICWKSQRLIKRKYLAQTTRQMFLRCVLSNFRIVLLCIRWRSRDRCAAVTFEHVDDVSLFTLLRKFSLIRVKLTRLLRPQSCFGSSSSMFTGAFESKELSGLTWRRLTTLPGCLGVVSSCNFSMA